MNVPLSENDMVCFVVVQLLLVGARAAVGVGSAVGVERAFEAARSLGA